MLNTQLRLALLGVLRTKHWAVTVTNAVFHKRYKGTDRNVIYTKLKNLLNVCKHFNQSHHIIIIELK